MDIEHVFSASSRTIFDVLSEAHGCQIPAYQRGYSWDATNVTRLLEDATVGLTSLSEDGEAVRFLGTIIAINEPAPRPAGWPRVLLSIIDGQQRLCTIVILNVLVHDRITALVAALSESEDEVVATLTEEATGFLNELADSFQYEFRRDGPIQRLYPKLVRALDDNWARTPADARYDSPIARFIWAYIAHRHGEEADTPFVYDATDDDGVVLAGHEAMASVIQFLGAELDRLATGNHGQFGLPDVEALRTHETYVRELWQENAPEGFAAFLETAEDEDETHAVEQLVRLTALARFVNFRMAATLVEARAEDYAFDMFEALNTTGQPLTAFETFKPKVVEAEAGDYPTSPSRRHVARIDAYLDRYKKADERQGATSALLIPFALAEDGRKLEKHLSYQRRYLRDGYRDAGDTRGKRAYVRHLANVASFVGHAWRPANGEPQLLSDPSRRDSEAEFCFEALRALRHEITLAPLARFYAAFELAGPGAERDTAARAYFDAVKAVTAFSMIWRANFQGTANIDGAYRDLMANNVGGAPPLCRRPRNGRATTPTVDNLRRALLAKLASASITRASWVRDAGQADIYGTGQSTTRFLLMAAAHDSVPDPADPGMLLDGRRGTLRLLSREDWNDTTMQSVEHVAPDARHSAGWEEDLYEDQRTVQRLGNFVLIPGTENNVLGNRPWAEKRVLYQVFGARTAQDARRAIATARRHGFNVTERAQELVDQSGYLPMCASIKDFTGRWNEAFVARRSTHLAGRAWDRIHPWLVPTPPRPRRRA